MDNLHAQTLSPTKLFYPLWWLQRVGYFPANYVAPAVTTAAVPVVATPAVSTVASVTPVASAASTISSVATTSASSMNGLSLGSLPTTASDVAASLHGSSSALVMIFMLIGAAMGYVIAQKTDGRTSYDVIA